MELLEKFKLLVNGYVGSSMLTNIEYPETIQRNAEKCISICNENTVNFLNWLENSGYRYNEDVKMFKYKDGRLQTHEYLVEIFSTK